MVTEQRRSQVPGEIHGAHPLDILSGEGVIGLPEGLQLSLIHIFRSGVYNKHKEGVAGDGYPPKSCEK